MGHSIANDDFPIEHVPDRPLWSENYLLTFFDPVSGIGGFLSLGRWVIRPEIWRSMTCIFLPNDRVLVGKNYGRSANPKVPDSGIFRIEVLEVGRRLRFVYDGPIDERTIADLNTYGYRIGKNDLLQLDLVFESSSPVWDMHSALSPGHDAENHAVNYSSPEGHIEQNGQVSGTIRYGSGEVCAMRGAPATRDHSRGPRNLTNYKSHMWTNGVFPSGKGFHCFVLKAHAEEKEVSVGRASVVVDGKIYDAELELQSEGWLKSPAQLNQPFTLSVQTTHFGKIELKAQRIQNSVPFALVAPADHYWSVPGDSRFKPVAWANEQKVTWSWDGEIGYGHLERGNSSFESTDSAWLANFPARPA